MTPPPKLEGPQPAAERRQPLLIGTEVQPWGTIIAVGVLDGERYYWLKDFGGCISMMPDSVIEANHVDYPQALPR